MLKNFKGIVFLVVLISFLMTMPTIAKVPSSDIGIDGIYLGDDYKKAFKKYGEPKISDSVKLNGVQYPRYVFENKVRILTNSQNGEIIMMVFPEGGKGRLATPKGITLGDTMFYVMNKYGDTDRTLRDPEDSNFYFMEYFSGQNGETIQFRINSDPNNQMRFVNQITIYYLF